MVIKRDRHGEFLAILSSIFASSVGVFWGYLLFSLSRSVLMTYWFGSASAILFAYFIFTKKFKIKIPRKLIIPLFSVGIISSITVFLLITSISLVGASLTSFIMQTVVIFSLLYGLFGFKEKFTKLEFIGVIIIIVSLFVLNWKADLTLTISMGLVLLAALFQATNFFISKKLLVTVPKIHLNLVRVFTIFLFGLFYTIFLGLSFEPLSTKTIIVLLSGVIVGPILGATIYLTALQKTKLSLAVTLRSIGPVFTFIFAFIFLGEILTSQQTIAVLGMLVGAYIILTKK